MSASVGKTLYSLISITCFPEVLEDPTSGPLSQQPRHRAAFNAIGSSEQDLAMPWHDDHWSRFWTNYLPGINRFKEGVNSDRAWDFMVPREVLPPVEMSGPPGLTGRIRRFLYPWAIVAVAEIELLGDIPVEQLAEHVSASRRDRVWQVAGKPGTHHLDHLLSTLTEDVQSRVVGHGDATAAVTTTRSVAAPVCGNLPTKQAVLSGKPENVDVTTGKAIAGLADLSPPGLFVADRLVAPNSSGKVPTRIYVTKTGHVLWHEERLSAGCGEDQRDTIGCLVRNQTAAVAHVEACSFVIGWAADRFRNRGGFSADQIRMLKPVIARMEALHLGDPAKTYRSEVVKRRIDPILEDITVAARAR